MGRFAKLVNDLYFSFIGENVLTNSFSSLKRTNFVMREPKAATLNLNSPFFLSRRREII